MPPSTTWIVKGLKLNNNGNVLNEFIVGNSLPNDWRPKGFI
jgi:hypothetical protein